MPDQFGDQLVSVEGVPGRWVDAGDLRVGDLLVSRSGGQSTVESVDTAHTPTTVYHIYVEDLHNYAVGDGEWLVHNGHRTREPNGQYANELGTRKGGLYRPGPRGVITLHTVGEAKALRVVHWPVAGMRTVRRQFK